MAVTECPNCHHDLQTPRFRLFGNKAWEDFACPWCRAKLERKTFRYQEIILAVVSAASVAGVPRSYLRRAEIIVPFIPVLYVLFNLSRPKLKVITAPYDEGRDLKRRLELRQSEKAAESDLFARKKDEAITDFRINPRRTS
jgi:hypothetical protein